MLFPSLFIRTALQADSGMTSPIAWSVCTGKGSEEVASEAISAVVTDYLPKEGGTDQ